MVHRSSTSHHPVDSGYAWVVLASCCIQRILLDGFWASFGILFLKWEDFFGSSSSETSLIGSIFMMILCGIAPVASALIKRSSSRSVVVGAGLGTFICCFAASFATKFWHLYIIMSLLSICMGMSYTPAYTSFMSYFDRHITVAFSLAAASTGVGFLALPPFMELLVRYYSWQGALMIMSAILANICVCGFLLRPSPRPTKTSTSKQNVKQRTSNGFQTLSESEDSSFKTSCLAFLHDVSADFDLSLFRNIRFLFNGLIMACLEGSTTAFTIYLVPYAVSVGISDTYAPILLLVYGIFMVLSRLSPVGVIVDRKIMSAAAFGAITHVILGIVMIVIPFVTDFTHLAGLCVVYGASQGIGTPMVQSVIADSPGDRSKAKGAIAWHIIAFGVGCLVSIFLCGFLYDASGTYLYSLILCGIWMLVIAVIFICNPLLIRCQSRLDKTRGEYTVTSGKDTYSNLSSNNNENASHV